MGCPSCQGDATQELERTTALGYHLFRRRPCRRTFNARTGTPFSHLPVPTDVALLVVLWRLRYKRSLRDLAEMFLTRGFTVTHETVRREHGTGRHGWARLIAATSRSIRDDPLPSNEPDARRVTALFASMATIECTHSRRSRDRGSTRPNGPPVAVHDAPARPPVCVIGGSYCPHLDTVGSSNGGTSW